MDKILKYKSWYHKSPRGEHRQENLRYSTQQYFTDMSPGARDIRERINKWDFVKIKNKKKASTSLKKTLAKKKKGNQPYGKIYLPMISWRSVWSPKSIKKSENSRKRNTLLKKWAKNLNRHFSKEVTQKDQRYMKGCSASLATRQMQIKTTMRYHLIPVIMAVMSISTNNR